MGLHVPKRACMVLGMDINKTTATLVAAAIATAGCTVSGVAAQTYIPRSTLQRKLAGEAELTVSDVHKIARALGVRTSTLLPDEVVAVDAA